MRGNEFIENSKGKKIPIRCYEAGRRYIDYQTVVYMNDKIWKEYEKRGNDQHSQYLAMIKKGCYGYVSVCGHGECCLGKHLGRRIPFSQLTTNLQNIVKYDIELD